MKPLLDRIQKNEQIDAPDLKFFPLVDENIKKFWRRVGAYFGQLKPILQYIASPDKQKLKEIIKNSSFDEPAEEAQGILSKDQKEMVCLTLIFHARIAGGFAAFVGIGLLAQKLQKEFGINCPQEQLSGMLLAGTSSAPLGFHASDMIDAAVQKFFPNSRFAKAQKNPASSNPRER